MEDNLHHKYANIEEFEEDQYSDNDEFTDSDELEEEELIMIP